MAITLGLVEAVDSSGVYVVMPGARGVVRGPYETLQNVVAGDKVLMVTTDDGDNVIVGLAGAAVPGVTIADGSITSAKIANGTIVDEDVNASAAIAKTKIAGTAITAADTGTVTNTMLAGSIAATKVTGTAITAADTGTVTNTMLAGSIAPSKVTGTAITAADTGTVTSAMIATGTITNDDINASAAIARSKISGLPTSSTDNTLPRFDSTGGALQTSGIVVDDNNRLRVASGSSGGLEIGSSGVLALSSTGDPSGVSAPVGSTWRQTDANATYGSLTGLLWIKVGTGTAEGTDWLVDYEGRWVSYTVAVTGWTKGSGTVTGYYTRSGRWVSWHCTFALNSTTVSGSLTLSLPVTPAAYTAGEGVLVDSGTSTYLALVRLLDTGLAYVSAIGTNGAFLSPTSTVPFTWANGDSVIASATYRI